MRPQGRSGTRMRLASFGLRDKKKERSGAANALGFAVGFALDVTAPLNAETDHEVSHITARRNERAMARDWRDFCGALAFCKRVTSPGASEDHRAGDTVSSGKRMAAPTQVDHRRM